MSSSASAGGLWSPAYGAIVGIVGEANDRRDGRAITLHQPWLHGPRAIPNETHVRKTGASSAVAL